MKTKYLILGAGPAGLTFANRLRQNGISDFIILEKENEAGGLCRSQLCNGSYVDIGGVHFLDDANQCAKEFLFKFLPESEWQIFDRDSRIAIGEDLIGHPIEANIWQFQAEKRELYLQSIKNAGCNNSIEQPKKFVDWIYWKLGDRIADDYMLPYNRKIFGKELNELGTYWLDKLPNVSYMDTLKSINENRAYGKQPGHARFLYPKEYGYGELWLRMAKRIEDKIIYNERVAALDINNTLVRTADGKEYQADVIVSSIPWKEYTELIGIPDEIVECVQLLKHSSVRVDYYEEKVDTKAHWIYVPDERVPYHRILVRHNFSGDKKGYWTESNANRGSKSNNSLSCLNEYAYPLNTVGKPRIIDELLMWCKMYNVYGLGRWGEHQHYNSDVVVEKAIALADGLVNM